MPSLRVFVLCYDDASEATARSRFEDKPWAYVLRIESTKYLESIMYTSWLAKNRELWQGFDYVGTIAYKAYDVRPSMPDLQQVVDQFSGQCVDVFALMPAACGVLSQGSRFHPRFLDIWNDTLTSIGYPQSSIRSTVMPGFYRNYWISTPGWMSLYIEFMKRVVDAFERYEHLGRMLNENAKYVQGELTPARCEAVFGVPYYTHHPFVCERLPCFFFWHHKASVVLV